MADTEPMGQDRMTVLVADDDTVTRHLLDRLLTRWGFSVVLAEDGAAALEIFTQRNDLSILVLDWVMPGIDGVELCRRVRAAAPVRPLYIILLTGKGSKADTVVGLDAGADDYLVKPFNPDELVARMRAGARVIELQRELGDRVDALEAALAQVKQLQGLLPICSYCKRIRDDHEYWHDVEEYFQRHTLAHFTHGICPGCYENIVQPQLDDFHRKRESDPTESGE